MKLWKWMDGRQKECKYRKLCLWHFRVGKWGFDGYILKYTKDTYLPLHKDPIQGKHWRLNIRVSGRSQLFISGRGNTNKRFVFFRPDLYLHSVFNYTKVTKLSFGFAKYD